jgi:hypothetical protein
MKPVRLLLPVIGITLLLSGCSLFGSVIQETSDLVREESEQEAGGGSQAPDTARSSGSGDIQMVHYGESVDFETARVDFGELSYEIPAGWGERPEMTEGSPYARFYTAADADLSLKPSNIVVEYAKATDMPDNMDFGDKGVYESFFEYISEVVIPQRPSDLTNIRYSVWETSDSFVYIYEADIVDQDGGLTHQTCCYPMKFGGSLIIFATDYADGAQPDVNAAARHIALSQNRA